MISEIMGLHKFCLILDYKSTDLNKNILKKERTHLASTTSQASKCQKSAQKKVFC